MVPWADDWNMNHWLRNVRPENLKIRQWKTKWLQHDVTPTKGWKWYIQESPTGVGFSLLKQCPWDIIYVSLDLRIVFLAQSAIGWNLFLRGYLTPLWDLLPCSNSTWRTKMLTLIYTDLHQLWQAHNELYHASTLKRWEQDKHRRLAATITFLHTLKPEAMTYSFQTLCLNYLPVHPLIWKHG